MKIPPPRRKLPRENYPYGSQYQILYAKSLQIVKLVALSLGPVRGHIVPRGIFIGQDLSIMLNQMAISKFRSDVFGE